MGKVIRLTESDLCRVIAEAVDGMKPELNVLWLDDMRSPEKYLSSNKTSGTFVRNAEFYKRIYQKYNVHFTWVRNLEEFQEYITTNGMPDLVSFDHDLGAGLAKGSECAKWLRKYCVDNNIPLPKYYIHSANSNAQKLIPNELGTNTRLNEVVYANKLVGNKLNLTYDSKRKNAENKWLKKDNLTTDKMDSNNDDTFIMPLKGGLVSYNITGINGTHVMHYFKNYFQNKKEMVKLAFKPNKRGRKPSPDKEYELRMEDSEFRNFMDMFKKKVWVVVRSCIKHFQSKNRGFTPVGISLYPVPSSSNFNIKMAGILNGGDINGLPIQVISQDLFVKDLRNLSVDDEFVSKNKDFYNSNKYKMPTEDRNGTFLQHTENNIKRQKLISRLEKWIDAANNAFDLLYNSYGNYNFKKSHNKIGDRALNSLVKHYMAFCDAKKMIAKNANYIDSITGDSKQMLSPSIYKYIKGYKPASVKTRSEAIWKIVKPYLRGVKSDVDGLPYEQEDIVLIEKVPFEIKKLSDAERMGLKNIYNPNTDDDFVRSEVEKTKNTVFVVFDDNISGGSTLSDVCMQAKNLGIEHIIPITFGKMASGVGSEPIPLNHPTNDNGERGYNY